MRFIECLSRVVGDDTLHISNQTGPLYYSDDTDEEKKSTHNTTPNLAIRVTPDASIPVLALYHILVLNARRI